MHLEELNVRLTTREVIKGKLYVLADDPGVADRMRAEGSRESKSGGCLDVMYESSLGRIPLSVRAAI